MGEFRSKSHVLFDLDGTLTDPGEGITNSVRFSLRRLGIAEDGTVSLDAFIGPPLRESYRRFFGLDAGEAERAVAAYREYFSEKGLYENRLYPGVADLLRRLVGAGRTPVLATSKPAVFAERILRYFSLDGYFAAVAGSELDGRRSDKAEVVRYALELAGSPPADKAVMVGDRRHDIAGAAANGIDSVGVLYGYGRREELTAAGAGRLAESAAELARLFGV